MPKLTLIGEDHRPMSMMLESISIHDPATGQTQNVPWMQRTTCRIQLVKANGDWRAHLYRPVHHPFGPLRTTSLFRDTLMFAMGMMMMTMGLAFLQALATLIKPLVN